MSFTVSEKIRIALSDLAVYKYSKVRDWPRAYRLAGRDLKKIVQDELNQVNFELQQDEASFINSEFIQ